MTQILPKKKVVKTKSGLACEVVKSLGSGGQGEVYQVAVQNAGLALKWYYPSLATLEQKTALENLIKIGSPNGKFLWPLEIVEDPSVDGFGYLMPLRDPYLSSINDLMLKRVDPSFRSLITACTQLCDSFFQLHAKGLCYRDISFGNVFFNPKNGDISICDNDNVTIDGDSYTGILGTPRFMAPEIVCSRAKPSSDTDRFSLSILLFYMLMVAHPLEGKRESLIHSMDIPAMEKLYGKEPIFIFDPKDATNRPVPGLHDNAIIFWEIYPQVLRDLFIQTFTAGLLDPDSRVRETIWRDTLDHLRDSIFYCTCKAENFYDLEKVRVGNIGTCWNCQRKLRLPPRLNLGGRRLVMLNYDTKLYPHHIQNRAYDFSSPVAEIVQNPQNPNIWGLKNLSRENWTITTPEGLTKEVAHNKSLSLFAGTKIRFGNIDGELRI
jgi:DNA-binding helix-hairpin-helix protein with protein kinase domain